MCFCHRTQIAQSFSGALARYKVSKRSTRIKLNAAIGIKKHCHSGERNHTPCATNIAISDSFSREKLIIGFLFFVRVQNHSRVETEIRVAIVTAEYKTIRKCVQRHFCHHRTLYITSCCRIAICFSLAWPLFVRDISRKSFTIQQHLTCCHIRSKC